MLTVIYLSKIYTLKFITIKDSYGFLHSIAFTLLPLLNCLHWLLPPTRCTSNSIAQLTNYFINQNPPFLPPYTDILYSQCSLLSLRQLYSYSRFYAFTDVFHIFRIMWIGLFCQSLYVHYHISVKEIQASKNM